MAPDKRRFLGVMNDVEYYYNSTTQTIEWRIPDIREAVRAPQGFRILAADYSQAEVKIVAYLSQDPWLIQAINSGKDIHSYMATEVFGKTKEFTYEELERIRKDESHPRCEELKSYRNQIKSVTFGIIYGAGARRIAEETGLDEDAAAELIDLYFSHARVLKAWLDNQGRLALQTGYSSSPRGRKRFYTLPEPWDPKKEEKEAQIKRWASNQPIQSGNVDMLKPAMYLIYTSLRELGISWEDARILFVVHDEIVMLCREELVPTVKPIMEKAMQDSYLAVVPTLKNEVKVVEASVWSKD